MAIIDEMARTELARKAALLQAPPPNPQKAALLQAPVDSGEAKAPQRPALLQAPQAAAQQAVPPRNVPLMEGVKNPNVGGPNAMSAEAAKYQQGTRAAAAAGPAPTAASPIAQQAESAMSKFKAGATATASKLAPSMPASNGMVGRALGAVARGGMGLAAKAAPLVVPAVEGARVAAVAMDPKSSKLDVATQGAEGLGKWGAAGAGAALGGGLGATTGPLAPIASPVLAVAGGAAGYYGGDELIKKLRSAVGLDTKSPVERTAARVAAPVAPVAAATAKPAAPTQKAAQTPPSPVQQAAAASTAPAAKPRVESPVAKIASAKPKAKSGQAKPKDSSSEQDLPLNGEGVVQILADGQDITVDFNRGISVPTAIYGTDKMEEYLNATRQNYVDGANPVGAKIREYTATEGAASKYRADSSAGASIAGSRIAAEADRYKTDKQAATEAEKGRIVTQEEPLPPDEMGVVKTIKRSYEKTKDGWKPIDAAPAKSAEDKNTALRQANAALAQGATLEDVNKILLQKGIDPIKK